MSTSSTTLTVHACPPHQVRAVLDVIDTFDLTDADRPGRDRIVLGAVYASHGNSYWHADDAHGQLRRDAPDATWTVHDDPLDGALAPLYRWVPALGGWKGRCDGDGNVYVLPAAVRRELAAGGEAALARLFGEPWQAAIGDLPTGDAVVEPHRYEILWDRKTGHLYVNGAAADGTDTELRVPKQAPLGDGMNIDRAPALAALSAAGFMLAGSWWGRGRGRFQEAEVYRAAPRPAAGPGHRDRARHLGTGREWGRS